jgi:predicted nuclease with TOPRIM domain
MKTFEIIDSIHHFLSDLTTSLKEKDSQIEGQNARIEALEQRLTNLEAQLADTHERLRAKIEEVNSLRGELGDAKIHSLEDQMSQLYLQLGDSQEALAKSQSDLARFRDIVLSVAVAVEPVVGQTKAPEEGPREDRPTSGDGTSSGTGTTGTHTESFGHSDQSEPAPQAAE